MKITIRMLYYFLIAHMFLPALAFPSAMEDYKQGFDLVQNGKYHEAINRLSSAIDKNNLDKEKLAKTYAYRSMALKESKAYQAAMDDVNKSIMIAPYPWTFALRGNIWYDLNLYDNAIDDHETALRLGHKQYNTYLMLAWLYATIADENRRDGKKAKEYMDQADKISKDEFDYIYDTRAAVSAVNGNFKQAVEYQKKAIELLLNHVKEKSDDKSWALEDLSNYNIRLSYYQLEIPFCHKNPAEDVLLAKPDSLQDQNGLKNEASYIGVIQEPNPDDFILVTDSGEELSVLVAEDKVDWFKFITGKTLRFEGSYDDSYGLPFYMPIRFYTLDGNEVSTFSDLGGIGSGVKSMHTAIGVVVFNGHDVNGSPIYTLETTEGRGRKRRFSSSNSIS